MITRRDLVARAALGSAGLALLPFTEHMAALAAGDASKLPRRFVFFTTANGITPSYLIPGYDKSKDADDVDKLADRSLREVGLTDCLASLEPLRDRTVAITGLSGKMTRGWHTVGYGTLGAYASGDKGMPNGETIDGALAKAYPGIFQHIGVTCNGAWGVSAIGVGAALPCYDDPIEVYNTLFGVISDDAGAKRRNRFDGKLLDFMVDDVKSFQKRLPGEEREKLDYYLNAYEQMSVRHDELLAKRDEILKLNPKVPAGKYWPTDGGLPWEDKVDAMCDLIGDAMIAGLTNVAAINTDGNTANSAMYTERSGFTKPEGGHGFGHGGDKRLPFAFNVSAMARLARKLDAVPEQTPAGKGTMLDNTLMVMVSTCGNAHHTRCENFPMVLVGSLGGKIRTGRHVIVPGYGKQDNATIGTMYTTILHAAGLPRDGFGVIDGSVTKSHQTNPLAELLI